MAVKDKLLINNTKAVIFINLSIIAASFGFVMSKYIYGQYPEMQPC